MPERIYYINGDSSYTSVTKWLGQHFPHFNADKIIDKMMKSKTKSKNLCIYFAVCIIFFLYNFL